MTDNAHAGGHASEQRAVSGGHGDKPGAPAEVAGHGHDKKAHAEGHGHEHGTEKVLRERLLQEGAFGWRNSTSYLDKVQDVSLLLASAYDYEFVARHHVVRDLMEMNFVDIKGRAKSVSRRQLYAALERGDEQILLDEVDDQGDPTGKKIDLYKEVHLRRLKEANALFPYGVRMKESELVEKFYNNQPLIIYDVKRSRDNKPLLDKNGQQIPKIVDLWDEVPSFRLSPEEFREYVATAKKNQAQLQILSTLRDDAITKHHSENAGHAQFVEVEYGNYMYMPVSPMEAANYVRADVRKVPPGNRADGHVHEIGWYEENTSAVVKFEAAAVGMWRGDITGTRMFEKTNFRMAQNSIALASGEKFFADNVNKVFHFGRATKTGAPGKIYEAMRHHYDRAMTEVRGYGITDQEIGDKIVTDVIGVRFAAAPLDWLMCFAKSTNMYTAEEVVSKNFFSDSNQGGKPVFKFDAKFPANGPKVFESGTRVPDEMGDNVDYGEIEIRGVNALAIYIQWRIKRGEIPGIDSSVTLNVKPQTKEQEEADKKEAEKPAVEAKSAEPLTEKKLGQWVGVVRGIFGEQAFDYVNFKMGDGATISEIIIKNDAGADVKYAIDTENKLRDFIVMRLRAAGADIQREVAELTNHTGIEEGAAALLKLFMDLGSPNLSRIRANLTPRKRRN